MWIVVTRAREGAGVEYVGPFTTDGQAQAWIDANQDRECLTPQLLTDPDSEES